MEALDTSPSFALPHLDSATPMGAKAQILIVDDNPEAWSALDRILRTAGMAVDISPTVPGFLAAGRPELPTCLILNAQLAGSDVFDFQRKLAAKNIFVPHIFVTEDADIPMCVRAMQNGADDFLSRPFRDQHLFDSIQRALARDRAWCAR